MKRRFFLWLSSTSFYRFLLAWVIPAVRFGGRLLPQFVVDRMADRLRVGDILLVKDRYKLSNILIGGEYSHCGIYMGGGVVAEMSHYNYAMISLKNFLSHSTKVAGFRLTPYDKAYAHLMVSHVRAMRDAVYDGVFSLGIEALYCSELIYHADTEQRMQVDLSDLAGLGVPYISPDGLACAKGLKEIFHYEM